jgi:DNA polymerase-3 subunit delta'
MWQGILQHDEIAERFRTVLRRGRLASTYLFVGPEGIGKRRFALALAKALLCPNNAEDPLEPCGRCESCRLFDAGNHPDLDLVGLPKDKSTLPTTPTTSVPRARIAC